MLKGDKLLNKLRENQVGDENQTNIDNAYKNKVARENVESAYDDNVNKVRVESCFKHASMLPKWIKDGKPNPNNFEVYEYSHFGLGVVAGSLHPNEDTDDYCLEMFGLNSESEKMQRKCDVEVINVTYLKMFGRQGELSEYLLKGKILFPEVTKYMAKAGNLYAFTGMTDESGKYYENTGVVVTKEIADNDVNVEILTENINSTLERFQIEKENVLSQKIFGGKDQDADIAMPNEEYGMSQNIGNEE